MVWCTPPLRNALAKRQLHYDLVVETEIVVSARKGHNRNPVTHKLAHLEETAPETCFIAAMDRRDFEKMCRDAEVGWVKEKANLRNAFRNAKHRPQKAKFADLPTILQARIKLESNGCWLWITFLKRNMRGVLRRYKHVSPREYGRVRYQGKMWPAHRLTYTLLVGPIPFGALLRHKCNTPGCVNPRHLKLGTHEDNFKDMIDAKRAAWQRRRSR
jgi:hypothetical protein